MRKMKKRISITSIMLLAYCLNSFAQQGIHIQGATFMGDFTISSSEREAKADFKGSPYYNQDFMFGEMELKDGNKIKGIFRYNIYAQELEFVVKKDTLIITDPTRIKNLAFSGKAFIYSLILKEKRKTDFISGAYFEVLNEGSCKVLIKREINLRENRYTAHYGGGGGDGSQRYIPELSYYIRLSDDKPALKLKKTKKSIIKLFDDHKNEIEKYISENKLKLTEDIDIIKVVEYYNALK